MKFVIGKENIKKVKADALVLGMLKGEGISGDLKEIDKVLGGELETLIESEKFDGEAGKAVLLGSTFGRIAVKRVLVVGLGGKRGLGAVTLRKAGIVSAKRLRKSSASIAFSPRFSNKPGYARALSEGLYLGAYEFNKYKTNGEGGSRLSDIILSSDGLTEKRLTAETALARAVGESTNLVRDLVNEPPVYMTPAKLAETAQGIAEEGGLKCEIFGPEEIDRRGMRGIQAVTSGSDREPRFIHLTYEPSKKPAKTVAIVGKGITFDSGGLCIKPADSMRTMKMDMAGAAAVLGVMKALPALKPRVRVHGLVASCENMTGPGAYKPDDVIKAYNGKTIEVINTDAEGRIVLSDALSYAVELKAAEIVDMATLTGACIVGLGLYTAGLMSNDAGLAGKILEASREAGEKIWELPLDDELRPEIKSDVADIKNAGSRWGGAITAAMFLENFVGETPWAHIDLAGPAYAEREGEFYPKGGTGFGVRTILDYILGL
ncbi:MAG TPA: leucyl aminopeptidase [Thermodesulfobacteriota bacterium]|nr:leucyl aminopeptidase [Thermodesulfobacteriota bacterium]